MPGFKLKERRLPSRRYPLRSISLSTQESTSRAILYRGGGFDIVWRSFATVAGIGLIFFTSR